MSAVFWISALVLLAVGAGVAVIRRWAEQRRILDHPNERSSHLVPTPKGGGLMIAGAALVALLFIALHNDDWTPRELAAFVCGALLITVISWIDDLRSLSNRVRIVAHFIAASLVVFATGHVLAIPGMTVPWGIAVAITLVWIAGLTNAYNFMDGIDGIAATQGIVAGTAWALLAWEDGNFTTASMACFLAAACTGFLLHNWPPARIFMGDVGSAFLGFAFASMPLLTRGPASLLTAVLPVWPFVFDTAFTFLRRLKRGEAVFSAHRSHLYQRLVIAGMSHRNVSLLYGLLAAIGSGLAIWSRDGGRGPGMIAFAATALMALLLWAGVQRSETRRRVST